MSKCFKRGLKWYVTRTSEKNFFDGLWRHWFGLNWSAWIKLTKDDESLICKRGYALRGCCIPARWQQEGCAEQRPCRSVERCICASPCVCARRNFLCLCEMRSLSTAPNFPLKHILLCALSALFENYFRSVACTQHLAAAHNFITTQICM